MSAEQDTTIGVPQDSTIAGLPEDPRPDPPNPAPPTRKKTGLRAWLACGLIPAAIGCGLVSLVGLYYLSGYILTGQIDAGYEAANCEQVVALADPAQKLYPLEIAPFVEPGLVQGDECRVYVNAANREKEEAWPDAYSGYLTYMKKYPKGVVLEPAREGAGRTLLGWGRQLFAAQSYGESVGKFNALFKEYDDTPAAEEAISILPQVHLAWAQQLEEDESFSKAASEYDFAIKTDPNPQASDSPAAQAKEAMPGLHLKWADALLGQNEYSAAVSHYQLAAQSFPAKDQPAIQDKLAAAYTKWAYALGEEAKYFEAVSKIGLATDKASGAATQDNINRAKTSLLKDFSNSSGSDAKKAMQQLADSICTRKEYVNPSYPIFANDSTAKKVYPSGDATVSLSSNVYAKSPSAMYYVACIDSDSRVMQTCPYKGGYYIKRVQYFWAVNVYDVLTGRKYRSNTIYGSPPQTCAYREWFTTGVYTKYYYGKSPTSTDLATWLDTFIK